MNGKVHVAIGVSTVACMVLRHPEGIPVFGATVMPAISLLTAAAGSYAPDIDSSRTHAGQQHKVASKVVSKVGGGHRGVTHSLLFPIVLFAMLYYSGQSAVVYPALANIVSSLLYGFTVGWIMHIFADLFNGKGCPILWPLMKHKIHILDLPSTGFVPWLFAGVLICGMVLYSIGGIL